MKLKKLLPLLAILVFAANAAAQEAEAKDSTVTEVKDTTVKAEVKDTKALDTAAIMKQSYSVRGGINFSSNRFGSSGVLGFHAGVMYDMPIALVSISDNPYLVGAHPSVQFIKKGGERRWGYYLSSLKSTLDAYYLEVPVPFSVKKTFSEKIAARLDLGPYIAFGLFGSYKTTGYATNNLNTDVNVFSDEGLSRFDAGLIYGAVLDYAKKYSIALHWSSGFSSDNVSSFYITLGYKL